MDIVERLREYGGGIEGAAVDEIDRLRTELKKHLFAEDRYDELLSAARRVYRYHGVDPDMTSACIKAMDAVIQRHRREVDELEDTDFSEE